MKLWIPREKAENRLKLQIVSSLFNFFSLHFSQTTTSFTLKILPTKVKEITDYCTITAIKEEVFIALPTCYFQKYRFNFYNSIKATINRIVFLLS